MASGKADRSVNIDSYFLTGDRNSVSITATGQSNAYVTPENGTVMVEITTTSSNTNGFCIDNDNTFLMYPSQNSGRHTRCFPIKKGVKLYWLFSYNSSQEEARFYYM